MSLSLLSIVSLLVVGPSHQSSPEPKIVKIIEPVGYVGLFSARDGNHFAMAERNKVVILDRDGKKIREVALKPEERFIGFNKEKEPEFHREERRVVKSFREESLHKWSASSYEMGRQVRDSPGGWLIDEESFDTFFIPAKAMRQDVTFLDDGERMVLYDYGQAAKVIIHDAKKGGLLHSFEPTIRIGEKVSTVPANFMFGSVCATGPDNIWHIGTVPFALKEVWPKLPMYPENSLKDAHALILYRTNLKSQESHPVMTLQFQYDQFASANPHLKAGFHTYGPNKLMLATISSTRFAIAWSAEYGEQRVVIVDVASILANS